MNKTIMKKLENVPSWRLHRIGDATYLPDLFIPAGTLQKEELLSLMEHKKKPVYRFRIGNGRWFYHLAIGTAVDMALEDYRSRGGLKDEGGKKPRKKMSLEEFEKKITREV